MTREVSVKLIQCVKNANNVISAHRVIPLEGSTTKMDYVERNRAIQIGIISGCVQ